MKNMGALIPLALVGIAAWWFMKKKPKSLDPALTPTKIALPPIPLPPAIILPIAVRPYYGYPVPPSPDVMKKIEEADTVTRARMIADLPPAEKAYYTVEL